ncbi:MAG: hypothetical protein NTU88_11825 [Armatimonadetes bacterium]|nr:hypothetical protein [Armatimonadota bacterium]
MRGHGPLSVELDGKPDAKVLFWLESSLKRVYPKSQPGSAESLEIIVPRNGQASFQACLRNDRPYELKPACTVTGADGKPIDTIRWEVWAESLQDYAILQTAGIKPNDPMLADIKSYADFPKTEKWINEAVRNILTR